MGFVGIKISIVFLSLFIISCSHKLRFDLLETTLDSISKAIDYYEKNYFHMNLDGVFGLRVLQGQIINIMDYLSKINRDLVNHPLIYKIKKFSQRADSLSKSSFEYLRKDTPKYLEKVGWLIINPWTFASTVFKNIYQEDKLMFDTAVLEIEDDMVEELSDFCIGIITNESHKCHLPDECLEFITRKRTGGYELTHQLLNTMAADMVNCTWSMDRQIKVHLNGTSLGEVQEEFCLKNFYEVSSVVRQHNGVIPVYYQDLFLEELMVCPMFGYYHYLHEEWLQQLTSWQGSRGCWMDDNINMDDLFKDLRHVHDGGRRLLVEKVLPDGCSSHKTAVAMAALTQFLRFLILCELFDFCNVKMPQHNYLLQPHFLPYRTITEPKVLDKYIIITLAVVLVVFVIGRFFFRRRILRLFRYFRFKFPF